MEAEILAVIMFAVTCGVLMLGFPVAFTLGGVALIFAGIGILTGDFRPSFLNALPSRYFGIMSNDVLVAVPLFVFMGLLLEKAKIAEKLLQTMAECCGGLRGGLGLSVIFVGMLLAASTGIVGATVVTMGLLSLMPMIRAGYDPKLATGLICASGTLGQIIPPSIVLVLLGDVLQGAHAAAQRDSGMWDVQPVSVIDLFAGAFVPGLLLVGLYMLWVLCLAFFRPDAVPVPDRKTTESVLGSGLWTKAMKTLLPPLLLILVVLGSILAGVATPTEAAAVGAAGALLLALSGKNLTKAVLHEAMRETVHISAMVFLILMGASIFSLVFRGLDGDMLVESWLSAVPGGAMGAMLAVMLLMFVMGFFLDFIEITFVVVPVVAPVLLAMGLDPVWIGVMIAVNLQTSFLTPPFGFALFYLRGIAPPEIPTKTIYQGVLPFVLIQIAMLVLLAAFPKLATALPEFLNR